MRRATIASMLAVIGVYSAAGAGLSACSGGRDTATTLTQPTVPKDTTHKVTTPTATLDSINRGYYDANNVLHIYPDSFMVTVSGRPGGGPGGTFSVPMTNFLAFTNNGVVTDPFSMQGMFGPMTLTSDNPAIVTPGGFCDGSGWPCLKFIGPNGSANVTVSLGGKSMVVPVILQ